MYEQIASNKRRTWALMTLFLVVIVILGYVWGKSYNFGYGGLIIALIFSIGINLISYFKGDKLALSMANAKQIKQADNPYVYRLVENLSITAGVPCPKIYLIPDNAINAFATGRDPKTASIAITTGAVQKLENEELEGVIAHELSHVKNYDIRLMTVVILCVGLITLLADFMLRSRFIFGSRDNDNNNNGNLLLIIGLVLSILSPIFATLIQLAVSRKREYLADASASLLTRYPEGLASALEKIAKENLPLKRANKSMAHLYIASPFSATEKISNLFSTHPPIIERVKKLRMMI